MVKEEGGKMISSFWKKENISLTLKVFFSIEGKSHDWFIFLKTNVANSKNVFPKVIFHETSGASVTKYSTKKN